MGQYFTTFEPIKDGNETAYVQDNGVEIFRYNHVQAAMVLTPEEFDYLCRDILRWVQTTDAVRKCVKTVESLIENYSVDAYYIHSTIDWLSKRTNDKELIKAYNKVYKKMAKIRHEGTK